MTTRFPYTAQLYTQNPESFADVYNGPLGSDYWDFLTRPEHVLLMEGATFLKQPAIVVLGPRLVQAFGPDLGAAKTGKTFDRTKQCLGHMVKDVLASLGYKIEQRSVPVDRFGTVFTTATRYTL
jgi:hypothetical protein